MNFVSYEAWAADQTARRAEALRLAEDGRKQGYTCTVPAYVSVTPENYVIAVYNAGRAMGKQEAARAAEKRAEEEKLAEKISQRIEEIRQELHITSDQVRDAMGWWDEDY